MSTKRKRRILWLVGILSLSVIGGVILTQWQLRQQTNQFDQYPVDIDRESDWEEEEGD
jgi:hypothetical protein